jgi:hypothetical protein
VNYKSQICGKSISYSLENSSKSHQKLEKNELEVYLFEEPFYSTQHVFNEFYA